MSDEFSTIPSVKPDKGRAQWMEGRFTHTETNAAEKMTTYFFDVPYLMPGTIIFVHGVNSEGEWYDEASKQFCSGLNKRLGRKCLKSPKLDKTTMRFGKKAEDGTKAHSPIIPFYWGYKLQPGDEKRYRGIYHGEDNAWGGGPFQNGTNNLLQFWQDGFKREILGGMVDLQKLNPEIDRQLQDAPPRSYFIHAAKRLANLVDTIRTDFPNEPLNIVAHSQGNMITLCAMLYVKQRTPDTLILNNAPYAFDTKITDWMSAANGWEDVQSSEARLKTFRAVADKIAQAKTDYKDDEKNLDKTFSDAADEGYATIHVQYEPERDDWHAHIGTCEVNEQGQSWHECEHASRDNRGKVFVNFNPHDRVIGVSAVAGMGWRGIPEKILGENFNRLPNVYQRVFARNSGIPGTFAVGEKQNYWFSYFHEQLGVREDVHTDYGGRLVSSYGINVQTENDYVKTYDNKPAYDFWIPAPNKAAGILPVQSTPGGKERVWINAPTVPDPAKLGEDFDQGTVQFDGNDSDNPEQKEDFTTFSKFYAPETVREITPGREIVTRLETQEEVNAKLAKMGGRQVAQTDHSQILQYGSSPGQVHPVEQIISYDLTVGQGHAYGDASYWQYLIDLADWKVSDPYYKAGYLLDAGSYPPGLDTDTLAGKNSQ
jgi:pimeloyl-ACP methyl ester carboxylesterase